VATIRTDTKPLTKKNDPEYLGIKEIELWRIDIEPNAPRRPLVAATAWECLGSLVFGKFLPPVGRAGSYSKSRSGIRPKEETAPTPCSASHNEEPGWN
jgi:hypothetical protein